MKNAQVFKPERYGLLPVLSGDWKAGRAVKT
ncbi:hypothetical protein QF004_001811 [Chryseobacterium sp. MDT2-18]|nr:hypothetical protein [Chryseobacterium sp. MDT2-18]